MRTGAEMLKTTEAAVVARVAVRDVNRAIDEGILPEEFFTLDDGRQVLAVACSLISFYFESAGRLTSEERLFAIKEAGLRLRRSKGRALPALLGEDWIVRDSFLTIDLAPFMKHTKERLDDLDAAREIVVSSPDVVGGVPVIRGTRIPVYDVAASVAAGLPIERILKAYPGLDAEKIELARIYADASPARGRPRLDHELPEGSAIISDRRVHRRRKAG